MKKALTEVWGFTYSFIKYHCCARKNGSKVTSLYFQFPGGGFIMNLSSLYSLTFAGNANG